MLSSKLSDTDSTIIILKICSIIGILAMGFGFGIMPNCINSCRTSSTFLGLSNAFSGGLFLGIGLFHILPEASEKFEEEEKLEGIPLAYFLAFLSYALILFVEKVLSNSHALMHDNHNHIEDESKKIIKQPLIRDSNTQEETKNENEIEEDHHHQSNSLTPYILLLALGFHGLFEGIALGISSTVKGTLTLLFAIAAHKWAASLTLGISFVKSGTENPQYSIMIGIFALIGPVGMLIGLILSTSTNEIVEGIFLAISTGTFIYIACSEVIVEEFSSQINKYSKFGLFMVGGLLAASLSFLEILQGGHHHDD